MLHIMRNSIRCKRCEDHIISEHRDFFVSCKCGACHISGGLDYLAREVKFHRCYIDTTIVRDESGVRFCNILPWRCEEDFDMKDYYHGEYESELDEFNKNIPYYNYLFFPAIT